MDIFSGNGKEHLTKIASFSTNTFLTLQPMVQRIINNLPIALETIDSTNLQLKICLEQFAISFLLQTNDRNLQAAEYFAWSAKDGENPTQIVQFLKTESKLFNFIHVPTVVYFRTENVMFLPRELAANARTFLQTQFGLSTGEGFLQRNINETITVAWKINSIWAEVFTNQFPGHTCQPNIKNLYESADFNESDAIYLAFGNGVVEAIVVFKQNLQLAKCFQYETIDDLAYHLLNICKQFGVQPSEVALQLQGFIENSSSLYRSLQTFFYKVQTNNADNTTWPEALQTLPAHYFTGLIQAV